RQAVVLPGRRALHYVDRDVSRGDGARVEGDLVAPPLADRVAELKGLDVPRDSVRRDVDPQRGASVRAGADFDARLRLRRFEPLDGPVAHPALEPAVAHPVGGVDGSARSLPGAAERRVVAVARAQPIVPQRVWLLGVD